jgi:hypothetical protein
MLLRLEDGGFSMSSDDIRLALVARGGVPLHTGFVTLKLTSAVPLRSIKIYWRNYYE